MKKKLMIIVLTITIICSPLGVIASDNLELSSEKTFGGSSYDEFYSVVESHDTTGKVDGYLAVGNTYSNDIEGITNKGEDDAIIVKYDLNGNIIWQKNYGGNSTDYFKSVIESHDTTGKVDGYLTVGYTYSNDIEGITNKGYSDTVIVKYDLNGNIIWQKNYGGSSYDYFNSVIESHDTNGKVDGYFTVGRTKSTDIEGITNKGEYDAIIVKYDLSGSILWQKNYGGNLGEAFNSAVESYDINGKIDGYLTVGYTKSTDIAGITIKGEDDAIIVKYDLNGNIIWQENYGGSSYDYFNSVIESHDTNGKVDGYLTAGRTKSTDIEGITNKGEYDAIIVKYDLSGSILWQKNYGGSKYDEFNSVVESHDTTGKVDGYLTVGETSSTNIDGLVSKVAGAIIVKYDLSGNMIWQDNYISLNSGDIIFNDIIFSKYSKFYMIVGKYVDSLCAATKKYDANNYIKKLTTSAIVGKSDCNEDALVVTYSYPRGTITITSNDNGNIEIDKSAIIGDKVTFKVTANNGYLLDKIIVTDKDGKEVSVTDNSFIMPEGGANIRILYKLLINPSTTTFWYLIVFIVGVLCFCTYLVDKKKLLNQKD